MGLLKREAKPGIVSIVFSEIRIEQTLFALPFVFCGALMGSNLHLTVKQFFLIVIALASARAFGMLSNRIIDRTIDTLNPRTRDRHLASGRLSLKTALFLSSSFLFTFLLSSFFLGPLPFKLSWIPILLFVFYPYTKRFTWLCHFFLGITLGLAPLAGWIAVTNIISPVPFLLMIAVTAWVSGFDIFYATMDVEFDRKNQIYSIPVRFGMNSSFVIALFLHLVTIISLIAAGILYGLGITFFIFATIASLFLLYNDLTHFNHLGTFRINQYLQRNSFFSVIIFAGVLIDLIIKKAGG